MKTIKEKFEGIVSVAEGLRETQVSNEIIEIIKKRFAVLYG